MKILLVDDSIDASEMMLKFFKLKNYECFSTNNGKKGLELIKSNIFDAILLDLAMPGFTGFDVIDELCKSGKIKESKIIVFTGST